MEDKSFDLLEERVKKAAQALRRLKDDNTTLAQKAQAAQASASALQERLAAAQKEKESVGAAARELAAARGEIKVLQHERDEVRKRVNRIVALLDEIEG